MLRPYQQQAIDFVSQPGDYLVALPMGGGKSAIAAKASQGSVRVICPASLKENWRREFKKWSGITPKIYSYGEDPAPADFTIFDEAHALKNPKSLRSRRLLQKQGKTLFLTGTPILKNLWDLWTLCHYIDPVNFDNRKDFRFYVENPKYLRKHLERFMFYRPRHEILSDLPDFERQVIPMEGDQDYYEVTKAALDNPQLRRGLSSLRVEAALEKVKVLLPYYQSTSERILIFAHHKEVIEALNIPNSVRVTGEMSLAERQASIDKFESGKAQFLIGSLMAAGVGLNLVSAHTVDFVEIDWTPAINEQAECRAHRIGQVNNVLSRFWLQEGSIDYHIYNITMKKEKEIKKVIV